MLKLLLHSLNDYHLSNSGGSFPLPKGMLNADVTTENGYALDNGAGSDDLVVSITTKGLDYIQNKHVQ